MSDRFVTDSSGRIWTCVSNPVSAEAAASPRGRDVVLSCVTPSVAAPVSITVGWQWEQMSERGLARILNGASPVPKR